MRRAAVAAALLLACSGPAPEPSGPLRASVEHSGPLRFAVVGDFGTGEAPQEAVAAHLRAIATRRDIDVLVTTGDNVYEDGNPEDFDEAWEGPYGWVEREGIDVVASLGNHDVGTGGGAPVMRLLGMPHRWYARRYGPVEFVVIDGNELDAPGQLAFLSETLERSAAAWRIVVIHHPPYTCGKHEGDADEVREAIGGILSDTGADVVLAGHDHNYQRFPPIDGVTVLVTGGGGADLHRVEDCDEETPAPVVAVDDVHHFLVARATPRVLRVSAVGVPDGSVIDTLVLRA